MIPERIESIGTNLPLPRLKRFIQALEAKEVQHVPKSTSMFAESAACKFDFEGACYFVAEITETVTSIYLVSGSPGFIQSLCEEHEVDLAAAVAIRDFDNAKTINEKIKSLKGRITKS